MRNRNNKYRSSALFALWGGISAAVTAVIDVLVGMFIQNPFHDGRSIVFALCVAAALVIPIGALLGLFPWIIKVQIIDRLSFWQMKRTLLRTKPLAIAALCGTFALLGTVAIGYYKGIQMDAIDFRPFIYTTMVLMGSILGAAFLPLSTKGSRRIAVAVIALGIGVAFSGLPHAGEHEGVLTLYDHGTTTIRPLVAGTKRFFDKDGDGYSTKICENDCDCGDNNPSQNPGAVDIPNNGIDEDCSGSDLRTTASNNSSTQSGLSVNNPHFMPPYNIILITIDTLRADRMHCYGHHRKTSPNLDRFAKENVRFAEVRSQGPSTRHIFPVMLTGRYFSGLDVKKGKKWFRLLDSNVTFAEQLKKGGYKTLAFFPYFRFKEHSGFQQGFDVWEATLNSERNPTWDPTGDLVTDRGIAQLPALKNRKQPWLLWLHYFDPHASYVKHADQPSFGKERADKYDGEILYVDRQVDRFFDALKSHKLFDDTAIIVASDHGEGIGLNTDHGHNYHGFTLFDFEVRVPLIIKLPKAHPSTVDQCVGLIDLAPTLLELGGITPPSNLHGVSLLPYVFGSKKERGPILLQLPDGREAEAIVDWPYKLIWEKKPNLFSLYNLKTDPHEQKNLIDDEPAEAQRLKNALQLMRYETQKK